MKKIGIIFLVLVIAFLTSCEKAPIDNSEYIVEKNQGNYQIYCVNGGEKQEEKYTTITVCGDWLYYSNLQHQVYKIKTDGSKRTFVLDSQPFLTYDEDCVNYLFVNGDDVFFRCDGFTLYKYNCKTQQTKEIYWSAIQIEINNGQMFLLGKDNTIFKMDLLDDKPQPILVSNMEGNDKEKWTDLYKEFIFVDNVMYYYKRSPDGLYKYENGESQLIDNTEVYPDYNLIKYDHLLFYVLCENNAVWKLKQYNPENSTVSEIATLENYKNLSGTISNDQFIYKNESGETIKINIK